MKRNLCLKLRPSEISPSIKTLLIILPAVITISLLSMSALGETNVTLLYGWNSTAWVPLKTSADGTLQTDLNLTQSLSLFPKTDNTYDLGSSSQRWRDLYVAGNAYLATTSGSVGINTTSPQGLLNLLTHTTDTKAALNVTNLGTGNSFIVMDSAGDTTPFLIDNAGKVGIGTASPAVNLAVIGTGGARVYRNVSGTTDFDDVLQLERSTSGDMADGFGTAIRFTGSDNGVGSSIFGQVGGIRDGADTEGALVFQAGTSGTEEFMRIDNDGNVGIGTTTIASTTKMNITGNVTLTNTTANNAHLIQNQGQRLCLNGASCSKYISYNGTNIVIQG